MTDNSIEISPRKWSGYNTIWRWHFYAGLFCIPFILVLSITGAIYLFKPQVEAALDRPYEHLVFAGPSTSVESQVMAAIAAVPGSVLNAYELPDAPDAAVRVLVGRGQDLFRVYLHPATLQVLKLEREDDKIMRVVHRLHGSLFLGDTGSNLVELAASWAIVLMITGLYLWWPRNSSGIAGVIYPRISAGGRLFWRDLHAVTGFWVSILALFLLLSGLPWAKSWGGLLKEVRHLSAGKLVHQDWTTGRSSELTDRQLANTQMMGRDEHAGHKGEKSAMPTDHDYSPIDRIVSKVRPLNLAPPVLVAPPSRKSSDWTARSDAQNRPLRVDLVLDARSGAIKSRKSFSDRPLLDRVIGVGIAAHEGQLFGWFNQALGLFTASGLILLSVSSITLWWKRRSPRSLGAPPAARHPERFALAQIGLILTLGTLLPFLGMSLLIVLAVEHWIFRYFPGISSYLGLKTV